MIELQPIIVAIGAGIAYSLIWYANKSLDPKSPMTWTDIDPYPIVATAVTGAIIGIASVLNGVALTQLSVDTQILAYGALTAVIERCARTVWHILQSKGCV